MPLNLTLQLQQPSKKKPILNIMAISVSQLPTMINAHTLIVDVRSFVKYSQAHILSSINIAVPNTILKRPSFTLDKVSGVIISEIDRNAWKSAVQDTVAQIIFYDEQSETVNENNAIYYLCQKLEEIGHKGVLGYIKGGMSTFFKSHANQCTSGKKPTSLTSSASLSSPTVPPTPDLSGLPPVVLGSCLSTRRLKKRPIEGLHLGSLPPSALATSTTVPFANDACNPFFSNIRQNMELCHGSIKERFPVRFPRQAEFDADTGLVRFLNNDEKRVVRHCAGISSADELHIMLPPWMRRVIDPELGPKYMAESYETIERIEQKRLQHVMAHHSKVSNNLTDHPFSIVAGIEKGTLNRYTNVWPFEYTRVKFAESETHINDYINASFIQYIDCETAQISTPSASTNDVPTLLSLNEQNESCLSGRHYRRYISTQGPLPTTFNDFWQVVWEQNSRVIVMLTKEEEMNRIKCHRYWPSEIDKVETFGLIQIKLLSQDEFVSKSNGDVADLEEGFVVRRFQLQQNDKVRTVHHFQYKGWQDFGVPNDPLGVLGLVSLVDREQRAYESAEAVGPMIVHCSAGCGRTGAFCTIDTLISRLKDKNYLTPEEQMGELDLLFQTVAKFREQRVSMVQTLRQYVFCYEAVLWWMLGYE
ncbi:protein-tyrosine phosphatase-like protein [Helicostylum pulchrum]|nr:protein-tyrosine phosphatase-like protein [Helicostylum pulchrum]